MAKFGLDSLLLWACIIINSAWLAQAQITAPTSTISKLSKTDPLNTVLLQYVMVQLKGSVAISFGGTQEPAAYGELVSIGGLGSDTNKKLSAAIAATLESKVNVPKSRFYIKFYDVKRSDFGWNGTTF